jgi:hypothetical protein
MNDILPESRFWGNEESGKFKENRVQKATGFYKKPEIS